MAPKKDPNEQGTNEHGKKEFGTGLRAQLQRRRDEEPDAPPAEAQPSVELHLELKARPSDAAEPLTVVSNAGTDDLHKQLAAAKKREEELMAALADQQEAFKAGVDPERGVSRRSGALDERDAKLAEFQAELEERERKVRDQRQTIEAEHARLAELQAELAAEQQFSAERQEQAERKLREL